MRTISASSGWATVAENERDPQRLRGPVRLPKMRKLCRLKGMTILRDPNAALIRLLSGAGRERGQSLTEYGLILAVVVAATVVSLGVLGSTVAAQLGSVTAALRGEGDESSFRGLGPFVTWVAIGLLGIGVVGLYLHKMRRR